MIKWHGIAKLQEEMGELQAVLGKLLAYPTGKHPDERYAAPILDRLHDELGDVAAAVAFFCRNNPEINQAVVNARIEFKTDRLENWHTNHDGMAGVYVEEKT